MKIQTLVVTTKQNNYALLDSMNIQTDAVFGNQCGNNQVDKFEYNGHTIEFVSTDLRGVGINRNEVLMRASGDICVLADDDMVFLDGYEAIVQEWFGKMPQADILVFNLLGKKKRYKNTKIQRISYHNYGKYGAARLVIRLRSVRFSGVMFHTMFGGGCEYSCGEDSLFLLECLKKGLKIYAVPAEIANIDDSHSTWFCGYTDKFFYDKGVLYYALYKKMCVPLALLHCLRYQKKYASYGWAKAYEQMRKGIEAVK